MTTTASHTGPTEGRGFLGDWEKILVDKLGPPGERIEESYHDIPLSDGHSIQAKVWRPKGETNEPRPVILLFHGGGFVAGSAEMCTRPGREFALEFNAVVISATYRLAPQHKFPQAALDGLDVLQWVIKNSEKEFGASPKAGLVVGGYSAGSQVAAVVASEARSKVLDYPVTGSFLCLPLLFMEDTVPQRYKHLFTSRDKFPPVGKGTMVDVLTNMEADASSPLFCPLHSSKGLAGLPPTYVQVGGKDHIWNDGLIYSELLKEAGVATRFDNHEDLGHESWTIFTDMQAPGAEALKNSTLDAMRWLLNK